MRIHENSAKSFPWMPGQALRLAGKQRPSSPTFLQAGLQMVDNGT